MATVVKFATIPAKYAPKRKMLDFALPQWRSKFTETENEIVSSWANDVYQSRVFKTQKEFNDAYDSGDRHYLNWSNRPMVLTLEDLALFEEQVVPEVLEADKYLKKMKAFFETGEKVVFVY